MYIWKFSSKVQKSGFVEIISTFLDFLDFSWLFSNNLQKSDKKSVFSRRSRLPKPDNIAAPGGLKIPNPIFGWDWDGHPDLSRPWLMQVNGLDKQIKWIDPRLFLQNICHSYSVLAQTWDSWMSSSSCSKLDSTSSWRRLKIQQLITKGSPTKILMLRAHNTWAVLLGTTRAELAQT